MQLPPARVLRRSAQLCGRLSLGLLVLAGLCLTLGVSVRPAHALSKFSVTDCSSDSQLQADVAKANTDNAGDVITFACSGDIKLSSTLIISGNMTLSGSGQQVTLDGGGSLRILFVNGGVSLTLNTLTIAHGFTNGDVGGGLDNYSGTVNISNSTFAYNSAYLGGGLFSSGGTVNISNSAFANNSARSNIGGNTGGGLDTDGGGTVNISNSTFAYNSASSYWGGLGGGLNIDDALTSGTVTISNSTFANNSASNAGGGLDNEYGSTVSISNSTIANNSAPSGQGGGLDNEYGTMSISGSIVAENTGGDCSSGFGTYTDNGYNLDSDSSCFTAATSLHTNPKLGPLASNGGPTQTMALLKGSPAIDYIPLASGLCPKTDQRGHKRPDNPQESACDIGAYES